MNRRTTAAALGVLTTAALALAGCAASPETGDSPSSSSLAGTEITVYNAQHEELTQEWADAFTEETGVTVVLRHGSDAELANQLVQEGAASPADVFLTENSPGVALVENAGLLADVDAETLALVPEQYRPSTGKWTGIAARATVFVYNTSLVSEEELPGSLLELAEPEWKGRWAASPSGADFQAIVSAVLELEGPEATLFWLKGMKENFTAYQGNSSVMKAVNAGEIPAGVIYHYYWYGDQAETGENSNNIEQHYFKNEDAGAFISISGGAVLASTKKAEAAQAFLRFIVGKSGQEILQTGTSFEYPVASDVEQHPSMLALDELDAPEIDPSRLDSAEVTRLMTEAGLI